MRRRGELMMIQRAVNQGWDMPESERLKCLALVREVLRDPDATGRERLRACKISLAMEGKNQEDLLGTGDRRRNRFK